VARFVNGSSRPLKNRRPPTGVIAHSASPRTPIPARMRPLRLASLIAAGLLCVPSSPAQDRLREEIDGIYRAGRYERALPERPEPRRPEPEPVEPDRGDARGDPRRRSRAPSLPPEPLPDHPGLVSDALSILPWIGCAVVVLAIAASVIRARRDKRKADAPAPAAADAVAARAPETQMAAPSAALALAREGRYAEAIHALLLAAIEAVRAARPLAASLTSREVLAAVALDPGRREALLHLVQAVEITRFGGRPADAAAFDSCSTDLARIVP
jgi:hypothetical protein